MTADIAKMGKPSGSTRYTTPQTVTVVTQHCPAGRRITETTLVHCLRYRRSSMQHPSYRQAIDDTIAAMTAKHGIRPVLVQVF